MSSVRVPHWRHEQGAILVISLLLLLVASIVTVTSMRGSNMQERMTSNQHNQSVAFMAAEAAASDFLQWLRNNFDENDPEVWKSVFPLELGNAAPVGSLGHFYIDIDPAEPTDSSSLQAVVVGLSGLDVSTSPLSTAYIEVVFSRSGILTPPGTGPFSNAIIGCEGVQTSGSGRIDSFDSRVGAYNPNQPGSNAHVLTIEPGADVSLQGNAPIYGNVYATGNVEATGSSPVHGSIYSDGNVILSGGGVNVYGDIYSSGNINFSSSATAHGNALANGNIHFGNWGASVHGNAQAGGNITSSNNQKPPQQHTGGVVQPGDSPDLQPIQTEACDPLDIVDMMQNFDSLVSTGNLTVGNWPSTHWVISPTGVTYFDQTGSVNAWVDAPGRDMETVNIMGKNIPVLSVDNMNLTSNGSLRISGGDVAIFIDGDFNLGGATQIIIDDDSSLSIYTTGKFNLAGSVNVNDNSPINDNNDIQFSIFSSYEQPGCISNSCNNNAGVRITGNTDLTGVVYAPFSNVVVGGSGDLYGAVRGATVTAYGAGAIHYDEALADMSPGGGGGGGSTPPGEFGISVWRSVVPM